MSKLTYKYCTNIILFTFVPIFAFGMPLHPFSFTPKTSSRVDRADIIILQLL